MSPPKIFISHRSTDKALAKALAGLFCRAMRLGASAVRCTSADGHRLKGGVDIAVELRKEVVGAEVFIGLITPASVKSPYVLIEIGARWSANRHFYPVLGRGADERLLVGPLGVKHALNLQERNQVIQLIGEIAANLGEKTDTWESFGDDIDQVVKLALDVGDVVPSATPETNDREAAKRFSLNESEIQILTFLASRGGRNASPKDVAAKVKLNYEKAIYHLQRLTELNLLDFAENWATEERFYSLDQPGRELLINRGLL